jgi:hypothetical protein
VLRLGGWGGEGVVVCCKKKYKEYGEVREGERRVDCQVIN